MEKVNRFDWIDYAKGLGIILVVYGHVIRGLNESKIISEKLYYYSDTFVYSFHMPLFFILSGFLFQSSFFKRGIKSFFSNKVQTLLYPFVIWSVIQISIEYIMSSYTNRGINSSKLFTWIVYPHAQFWFLHALFFINLINISLFSLSKKFGLYLSFLLCSLYFIFGRDLLMFENTFKFLLYFNIGILLSQYLEVTNLLVKNRLILGILLILFVIAQYLLFTTYPNNWYNYIFPQITGSLLIINLSDFGTKTPLNLRYLGNKSMVIYLAHILGASGTRIILLKIFKIDDPYIHIISGTVVGLVFPLILYKFLGSNRYTSFIFEYPTKDKNLKPAKVN